MRKDRRRLLLQWRAAVEAGVRSLESEARVRDLEGCVVQYHQLWQKERTLRIRSEDYRRYDGFVRQLAVEYRMPQDCVASVLYSPAVEALLEAAAEKWHASRTHRRRRAQD